MELVYLWVRKYKNIDKEGFDFSPRFHCKFFPEYEYIENDGKTFEKLKDKCKLEIIDKEITNESYPKDFFGDKISLTAIVGENGASKSSLLEILANKYSPVDFQNLFFIFYDKKNKKLTLHGAKNGLLVFINESELKNKKTFQIDLIEDFQEVGSTKTVYFSNILNENDLILPSYFVNRNYSHTVNISTTQILNQMKSIETKYEGINSESRTGFDKIYRSYRIQEIQRAIILIKDQVINIPFELPKSIEIRNIDFKSFIENAKNKFGNKNYQKILDVINRSNDNETIFKNYLSTNLIIALLLENANTNNPILDELLQVVLDQKMVSHLEHFYNNVKSRLYGYHFNVGDNSSTAIYINVFFDLADKILEAVDDLQVSTSNGVYLQLSIQDTNFDFLKTYEKLIQQSEYFWDISWRGISSGEETYLYQFSRLYFLQKGFKEDSFMNLKIDSVEAKNIILLIDEGEITLHPNWQKEYIKFLIHFLKDNFHQNLHLILTSHSPFILSDIPKEHIIFLEKGKQVYPFKESEQTFGTNIHTLLSHGFFMNKGLVGEFAKEKIQYVINILNEEIPNIEKSDEMQHIISCIGEQFLKKKLQQKYDDVFLDEIARNEKIVLLERQIERLKNVKH